MISPISSSTVSYTHLSSLGMVDMEDYESLQYFQRVLIKSGIIEELEHMGINEGDTVSILNFEFDYIK